MLSNVTIIWINQNWKHFDQNPNLQTLYQTHCHCVDKLSNSMIIHRNFKRIDQKSFLPTLIWLAVVPSKGGGTNNYAAFGCNHLPIAGLMTLKWSFLPTTFATCCNFTTTSFNITYNKNDFLIFKARLTALVHNIKHGKYFGRRKTTYFLYVIEYQFRGLPHAHIVFRSENAPNSIDSKLQFISEHFQARYPEPFKELTDVEQQLLRRKVRRICKKQGKPWKVWNIYK